ncbi:hypothetical protein ACGYLI_17130 [Sulfitobacter sp. 1A13421]|uniref:hypothetical protein n=1 Tax=Sulfitobacter sp. 1A13421 TaxID=3368595 RepID=UPI00374568AB
MRSLAILTLPLVCLAEPALADWNDREICRAAAKVYFFTKGLPADAKDQDGYFGLQGSGGVVYGCRIDGNKTSFHWVNKDGTTMKSNSTTFEVNGGSLTVKTDLLTESFTSQ